MEKGENHEECSATLCDITAKVKKIITLLQEKHKIPAVTVGIVKKRERVSWTQNSDVCEKCAARKCEGDGSEQDPMFAIGSLSKAFTAAALAMVIQQEPDLTWDTPLTKTFGDELRFGDAFRTSKVCFRDLLAHKVGIELGESDFGFMCGNINKDDFVRKVYHLPVSADFRTKMMYNNFMYELAGAAVEARTGFTFEDFVQKNIIALLGMDKTFFVDDNVPSVECMAPAHVTVGGKLIELSSDLHRQAQTISAAGGLFSTAKDMCKWMNFWLNRGKVAGIQVIKSSLIDECWKPQFALPSGKQEWDGYVSMPDFPATETRDTYGFAWYLGTYRGYRTAAHSGELFGYDSLITLFRDLDVGIYTNVNGPSGEPAYISNQLLHYYIADCLLDLKPWLDKQTILTFPEPWQRRDLFFIPKSKSDFPKSLKPSAALASYEGTFHHGFLGCAVVSVDANQVLTLNLGKIGHFVLYPNGEDDEFRMEGREALSFLHEWDLYSPTDWMTVKFVFDGSETASEMYCSLFESGPAFKKVVFFIENGFD